MTSRSAVMTPPTVSQPPRTVMPVIGAVSAAHLLNDMMQSLLVAIYPLLKGNFDLTFAQIGLITLVFQLTASLLQPWVGHITDRRALPYSLPLAMGSTLLGLVLLGEAPSYGWLLLAAGLIGLGSAVFHPESSRVARLASGGRHGLAQSLFQVGGNLGSAVGPLLAAWLIVPHGQHAASWVALAALLAIGLLLAVSRWYAAHLAAQPGRASALRPPLSPARTALAMSVLGVLVFSKYFYLASLSSYYTFYLIDRFHLSVAAAQTHLFVFLFAVAAGTVIGGPVGDRIGRKPVIWVSILGAAPFSLLLPHADLAWTGVLSVVIGVVLASAFSAILVYAQELMPHRIGVVSGLFYGFSFGMGGIGAALLGELADRHGIAYVYQLCAYLPLLGLLAGLLPRRPGVRG